LRRVFANATLIAAGVKHAVLRLLISEDEIMRPFTRNALLGAAGLVAVSLPAQAMNPLAGEDGSRAKSATTEPMKVARDENPGGAGNFRDENPGGAGNFKKTKKSKKKTK
jgi:hypothetical protein